MDRVIGTVLYMAPEVVQRQPYDEMSDIWAIGIVLFVMLTGRIPYKERDMKRLVRQIVMGNYDKAALKDPSL